MPWLARRECDEDAADEQKDQVQDGNSQVLRIVVVGNGAGERRCSLGKEKDFGNVAFFPFPFSRIRNYVVFYVNSREGTCHIFLLLRINLFPWRTKSLFWRICHGHVQNCWASLRITSWFALISANAFSLRGLTNLQLSGNFFRLDWLPRRFLAFQPNCANFSEKDWSCQRNAFT